MNQNNILRKQIIRDINSKQKNSNRISSKISSKVIIFRNILNEEMNSSLFEKSNLFEITSNNSTINNSILINKSLKNNKSYEIFDFSNNKDVNHIIQNMSFLQSNCNSIDNNYTNFYNDFIDEYDNQFYENSIQKVKVFETLKNYNKFTQNLKFHPIILADKKCNSFKNLQHYKIAE